MYTIEGDICHVFRLWPFAPCEEIQSHKIRAARASGGRDRPEIVRLVPDTFPYSFQQLIQERKAEQRTDKRPDHAKPAGGSGLEPEQGG